MVPNYMITYFYRKYDTLPQARKLDQVSIYY